jgi:predicted SAM-dependent methyltransferase
MTMIQQVEEQDLITALRTHIDRSVPGSGISQMIGRLMPQGLRPWARTAATKLVRPQQALLAQKLGRRTPLQLNLGCGTLPLEGWVNVDLIGLPVDLAWDIRQPLPFKDNVVDAIFHEHVMEHVSAYQGYLFLKESLRVLKKGGVLRIVMPDASRYIRSYVDPEHEFLNRWRPGEITPMMALQHEFYSFGHCAMYDYETLALFCRSAGFATVESKQFGESRIVPCPDSEWRITDSFYTEAVK